MSEQIGRRPDDTVSLKGSDRGVPLEILSGVDSVTSTQPGVLPLVNYDLIHVAAEAEARERLLKCVAVDTNGVASLRNTLSGIETMMVAVRIDDEQNATVIHLVGEEDGVLHLPLPADKPSRIGFFVGYRATNQSLAATIRNGLYPGVPLVTQAQSDARNREIMIGIGGIKPSEEDHLKWAGQIDLENLGFDQRRLRGVFGKYHRPNQYSDQWQEKPFVMRTDDLADILPGYDPNSVRTNEFQMLFYYTREVMEARPSSAYRMPAIDDILGQTRGFTRGGGQTLSFGGGHLQELSVKGLGLGFGEAVERHAQTTGVRIESLEGAFRIVAIPC